MQVNLDYQLLKLKGDGLVPGLYFEPGSGLNRCYYSCVITPSPLPLQAFWREKGFSGEILTGSSTGCPFAVTFDGTSPTGKAALVGFMTGEGASRWTSKEVRNGLIPV